MPRFFLFLFFLFCNIKNARTQPFHDANWVVGATVGKGVIINFLTDSVFTSNCPIPIPTYADVATVSDERGSLIAYSNGCEIINKKHQTMSNGKGLNPGGVNDSYCNIGYPVPQGMLFLPHPLDTNLYTLFHIASNIAGTTKVYVYAYPLYYTIMDKSKNNDEGQVISKNNIIIKDTISHGQLTATKHGNSNSWWIVVPKLHSNFYYKLLFTAKGIEKIDTQSIGKTWEGEDIVGSSVFSPNGRLYTRIDRNQKLHLFNFDRCSGKFSNFQAIEYREGTKSIACTGTSFSPNNRFLYVTTRNELFQFDVQANDIEKSRILIDTFDGFKNPLSTAFFMCQLAANNKIYIGSTNGVKSLHTIHSPDSLGKKCDFKQHDFQLPVQYFIGIPHFPNYRLGASDVICAVAEENLPAPFEVTLFPNPTSQTLTIQIPNNNTSTALSLYNSLGQVVYTASSFQAQLDINVQPYPNGLYFCTLQQGTQKVVRKVVIQKE